MRQLLKFGRGNAKLGKNVWTFSLPAGHACPFAHLCLSKADKETGKIKDGPHTEFRCFSASTEAVFPSVRRQRWHNFEQLRGLTMERMYSLIFLSLPKKAKIVRIHVSGDFFSLAYFLAWCRVARENPDILFYAYTKSLAHWVKCMADIPPNLVLTASRGGTQDDLIAKHGLREARVVYSVEEAETLGYEIDHDDSHAMSNGPSFALLIHGVQPAGSKAASAMRALDGLGSYSRKGV